MTTDQLVQLAKLYGAHNGLRLSTVSTYAARDGKYFGKLEAGADCTLRSATRLVAWFDEHWPDDLQWPRDIPRPSKSRRVA